MLTIRSSSDRTDCDGLRRRDFLRVGGLGLGGLSLSHLLRGSARAAGGGYTRDKAVVFLFLCGGPSHIETFAPNMDAPSPRCSVTGEIQTSLPGVTFGATLPKLAALADRLAVVRSYAPHEISDHAKAIRHVFTAGDPAGLGASIGAMYTRVRGDGASAAGLPIFNELIEEEVDSQYREDMERMRSSNGAGKLGAACAAFAPGGDGQLNRDMTLNLPLERLDERRALVRELDGFRRAADASGEMDSLDTFGRQALDLLLGGAAREALDLTREDPRVVRRYDTSQYQRGWLAKRSSTLGRRLLIARRLVEAGCGFVTVGMAGWDNHGNQNHPGVDTGMRLLCPPLDHAVSAFLEDLEERGLSEKVLLVITGEFGRTPKIQDGGGRDHWPGLCPLVFAGGGLRVGQVVGRMARAADVPATDPWRLENLFATIMQTMFDVGRLRLDTRVPRDLARLIETGRPIESLVAS